MLVVRDDCVTGNRRRHVFCNMFETQFFLAEQLKQVYIYCAVSFSTPEEVV